MDEIKNSLDALTKGLNHASVGEWREALTLFAADYGEEVTPLSSALGRFVSFVQTNISEGEQILGDLLTMQDEIEATNQRLSSEIEERIRAEEERKKADAKVADLNRELIDASRRAGMAEIATGVLHNVGNVLNSVNVSSEMLRQILVSSRLPSLKKCLDMLNEQNNSGNLSDFLHHDAKGKKLLPFIDALLGSLEDDHTKSLAESARLRDQIDHVMAVVAKQQDYAKTKHVLEECEVPWLVKEALSLMHASFRNHGVEIHLEAETLPPVMTDRNQVIQILINLLGNAHKAVKTNSDQKMSISVLCKRVGDSDFSIAVTDTGVGIAPENTSKVFTHGFTTWSDGHGFGLHNSANAATALGGRLSCFSEGLGHGSTFDLRLPINPQATNRLAG